MEPITVESFAHKLSAKQLACRELGHSWAPQTVQVITTGRNKRIGGYERVMRCKSCRTERIQVLDSSGHVVSNRYNYLDGYLANHVQPGFTRDTFRLEAVTRWLDSHHQEAV